MTADPPTPSTGEPQLASGSTATSPDSAKLTTPSEYQDGTDATPQPLKTKKELDEGKAKTRMPPPPLPINVVNPTPPRMSRLPSLQQISSHLHHSSSPTNPPSATGTPSSAIHSATDSSRPSLSLSTNIPASASTGPGFASSPSGRLKMPVSAMKRTMSNQASGLPSPLTESSSTNKLFNTTDPFASPTAITDTASTPKTAADAAHVPPPMARGASKDGFITGYKAVPSLAQIKQRHQEKSPSVDIGKENIAEKAESVGTDAGAKTEDTDKKDVKGVAQTQAVEAAAPAKKASHPLRHSWTMYFDSKTYKPPASEMNKEGKPLLDDWEASLLRVGDIDTVENFARHFNHIRLPSRLTKGANYHFFKKGIRPMWEDPANANGGKWVVLMRNAPHLMDFAWANLVMGLVGNVLDPDDQVCGIVASCRPKVDRVQLWTRSRSEADAETLSALGKRIVECMSLDPVEQGSMSIEFQYNASDAHPPPGLFFKQTFPPTSKAYPSNVPATPSRLGNSHIPPQPESPNSRNGATSMSGSRSPRMGNTLGHPGQGEAMRRRGSGQGIDAFSGPMGSQRSSFSNGQSGRLGAAGGQE